MRVDMKVKLRLLLRRYCVTAGHAYAMSRAAEAFRSEQEGGNTCERVVDRPMAAVMMPHRSIPAPIMTMRLNLSPRTPTTGENKACNYTQHLSAAGASIVICTSRAREVDPRKLSAAQHHRAFSAVDWVPIREDILS